MAAQNCANDKNSNNSQSKEIQGFFSSVETSSEASIQETPSPADKDSSANSQQSTSDQSPGLLLSDISDYINRPLEDSLKFRILKNDWTPKLGTTFPLSQFGPKKRSFQRQWLSEYPGLVYSEKTDGILCIFCSIFPCDSDGKRGVLVRSVYRNWKHAKEKCNEHFFGNRGCKSDGGAGYQAHADSRYRAEKFIGCMEENTNIVLQMDSALRKRQENNMVILESIVKTVILCGRQNLGLRGDRDDSKYLKDETKNCGNFQALLDFRIDSGDKVLQKHFETAPKNATYRSKTVQNELIEIIGEELQKEIVSDIQKAGGWFCISADEVRDVANKEQLSICARYADVKGEIRERFLTFQNVSSFTTGERLSSEILSFITDVGLNPDRLRSQCYDGAGNMTGKVKGVGPRIQRLYPKALHFWCVSHLNRCIVAACDLQQVRNMMGTADKVVTFFNWSPTRQTVLEDHVQKINTNTKRTKLLELCRTRWIQRHDAFEAFKDFLPVLVDALEDYLRKETRPDANTEASGLLHAITAFPFIMTLVTVQQCLGYIKSLSKVLQGRALDIVRAMDEVTTVADTLTKLRANIDAYSGELFTEAVKLAESVDVQPAVPRLCGRQTKRANTPASTPEEYYKRSLVIPFLDHLNQQMADRFSELNRKGTMGLHLIPPVENSVKPQTLSFFEDDLPSPATLSQEIELWRRKWTDHQTPPATLQETLKACNGQLYPNIKTVLQITATFPVTSCECERSISTLGIVKTKLRATMGQDRLTGLCLLSRHRDIHVEPRDIVKMYARKNPRRMVLPDILADDEETQ